MRTVYTRIAAMAIALGAVVLLPISAQAQMQRGKAEGEVQQINKELKRVTLKHGPIEGIDMAGMNPAGMTMVFQVKDSSLLDKVKVGDKVRFTALRENGAYFVESFEPAAAQGGAGMMMEPLPDPHAGH